ncbi:MAG: Ada metal-binding domain-containing protein [Aquabacterium sp.]|nr:Ada metal-binding domain-containing protein [Aquabacterium sp.]
MSSPGASPTALNDDVAYQALRTHDARFDGRLFIGVTSTGIYCRPVCRVKPPKRENCRFFANAALAETQGFRPCLRCRPELAPGLSFTDSSNALADQAARWLAQAAHAGQDPPLPAIAARLGVTDRHLRRIFARRHGVSPVAWLATQRLLLAKQLLTDTALPVTEVALATGFGSLRRFNAAFAGRYRLSPSALRREGAADPGVLKLAWRPPYDLDGLLGFMTRRAVPGQEQVDGLTLRRTLALPHQGQWLAGWIEARFLPERHELHLGAAPALRPALGALLQRARQACDLDADPTAIDPVMASVPGRPRPGLRLPGSWDGFDTAVRVVLGQQVTVAAARTLCQRLMQRFGAPVATPFAGLNLLFPTAAAIATADPADIGTLGIVRQRVRALQGLAQAVVDGRLHLQPGADLPETLATLTALPGIGDWSAQLIALRTLGWPDAWPASDIALLKGLGQARDQRNPQAGAAIAEAWRPWRGYAVIKLWLNQEDP